MLAVKKQLIGYNFSTRTIPIKYIIIHDVGAVSTAQNNRDYFNGGNRGSSADFFIDSKNIIQCIDYNKNYSWAIGDGKGVYGITNNNSLSIEMCLESNLRPSIATIANTIDVVQKLMKELNIPIQNVVRHYDASRKPCPQSFISNNWALWNEFKKQLVSNVVVKNDNSKILLLQKVCNRVGIRGANGKALSEDGLDGTNTQAAKIKLKAYIAEVTK